MTQLRPENGGHLRGRGLLSVSSRQGRSHEHSVGRIDATDGVRDRRLVVGGGSVAADRIRSERRRRGAGASCQAGRAPFLVAGAVDARSDHRAADRRSASGSKASMIATLLLLNVALGVFQETPRQRRLGAAEAAPDAAVARQARRHLDRAAGSGPRSRRYRATSLGDIVPADSASSTDRCCSISRC